MATNNVINTGMPIEATHGGTGTNAPTIHTLPVAQGASAFNFLGPLTDGQLLIGSTGNDPVAASISAGTNISITPGSGTISIATTGSAAYTWTVETVSLTMVVNHGYIANKAGTLVLTLPAVSAVGDVIEITGMNTATGWQVAQNAGNTIYFGTSTTTPGIGGSLTSTAIHDSIKLVCLTTSALWQVVYGLGNITVV